MSIVFTGGIWHCHDQAEEFCKIKLEIKLTM